ncbi:MAG: CHASE2 domain-containing protein, partial [Patescibacteria group bacterium]
MVGEYGTLIHDEHFSPADLGKAMPGVEFHANFLDALITGQFLRSLTPTEIVLIAALAALAGSAVFLFASVPVSVAFAFAFLAGTLLSGWYAMA